MNRKHIAALAAFAGLAAAGTLVAAESNEKQGCAGERHASAGEHRGHGMERMQERHARMAERHGRHGATAKPEGKSDEKAEEHKH
jgi:hypothetical protein